MRAGHRMPRLWRGTGLAVVLLALSGATPGAEPPNPFAPVRPQRKDAVRGVIELSNGTKIRGRIFLTRGHFLRIYDPKKENFRDVPLRAAKEVRCLIEKEWMEKEWRFKENASDEKVYTGREYPARIYVHEIELKRGGTIRGPLAAVVYIRPDPEPGKPAPVKPLRFLLHKRHKGDFGQSLKDLVYVKRIVLGAKAEGRSEKADERRQKKDGGSQGPVM